MFAVKITNYKDSHLSQSFCTALAHPPPDPDDSFITKARCWHGIIGARGILFVVIQKLCLSGAPNL